MTQITLYTGGGISLSPVYTEGRVESDYIRLVADDGMMLIKGDISTLCIDVLKTEVGNWNEVEYVDNPILDDSEALEILLGGNN